MYLKSFVNRETLGQVIRVIFIGGFNTIVYFVLLNVFLEPLGRFWAITAAYGLATTSSYVMNRRWSFQISDGSVGSARESASFFIVNLVAWGLSVVLVEVAHNFWGPLSRLEVNLASMLATGIIVIPKFAAYRDVVFKKSLEASDATFGSPAESAESAR